MQIRVNTEYVRDTGRRFINESAELGEIGRTLHHAIDSLDTWAWDGRSRVNAEFLLSQVRPESASLADKLEHLGRLLQHVAERFEDEDGAAAQTLGDLPWVDWGDRGDVLGATDTGKGSSHGEEDDVKKVSKTLQRIWDDFLAVLDVIKEKLPFLGDRGKEILDKVTTVLDQWNFWKTWKNYQEIDQKWLNNQASYDDLLTAKNAFMKSWPGVGTALGLLDILAVTVEQAAKIGGQDDIVKLAEAFQSHLAEIDFARAIDGHLDPSDVQ